MIADDAAFGPEIDPFASRDSAKTAEVSKVLELSQTSTGEVLREMT